MGYNLKSLTSELQAKNMADDGLVAWGQNSSGALFGAVGALLSSMHTISMHNDQILIIPFTSKQIKYDECQAINKSDIVAAKVSGLLGAKLVLELKNGKKVKCNISQGKDAVKEILKRFGF